MAIVNAAFVYGFECIHILQHLFFLYGLTEETCNILGVIIGQSQGMHH